MKKWMAFVLASAMLLSVCSQVFAAGKTEAMEISAEISVDEDTENNTAVVESTNNLNEEPGFTDFSDSNFLQYVKDSVYAGMESAADNEDIIIENIESIYVSQEYLDEVAYNSRANVFFGYTLAEIDEVYCGSKYVFTLGENGTTVVQPFADYDATYEQIVQNVAVGTGVVLVCVTASVATGAAGMTSVSMVLAASAKTAASLALAGGRMGAISNGIIEGIRTKDFKAALKKAALKGSESFKWGAVCGTFIGGAQEIGAITRATKAVQGARKVGPGTVEISSDERLWRQAELRELNRAGGYEQLSYLDGKQVPFWEKGATRPDIVRYMGDHIEAVEVKSYDLMHSSNRNQLYDVLVREITSRVKNLPAGSTQRIVLDVTGREATYEICNLVKNNIWTALADIYPNIPIDIVGLA